MSTASDAVPGDTNGVGDVVLRDLMLGTNTRVSRTALGGEPNALCTTPSISDDGQRIAYQTSASNIVSGDTKRSQ
jgi:Tol biopolymer transport system component